MTDHATLIAEAERLCALVEAATPVDLSTAQEVTLADDGYNQCPMCHGEGALTDVDTYENIDRLPLSVQFFGIGEHFGTNQKAWDCLRDLASVARRLASALQSATVAREGEVPMVKIPKAEMDAAERGEMPSWESPLMTVHQHGAEFCTQQLAEMLGVENWNADGASESYEGDLCASLGNLLMAAIGKSYGDFKIVAADDAHPPKESDPTWLVRGDNGQVDLMESLRSRLAQSKESDRG